jgi:energy-coupling factor transport system permease protein
MQDNNLSRRASAATVIQRLDPRTKLALLLISFMAVLLPERPEIVAIGTLAVLGHMALARAWGELRRIRGLLVALALFSVVIWSLMARGPHLIFGRVSQESVAFGVATFLRLGTMMVAGLTLLASTSPEELFLGLVKLRLPYPGAFAFALALRWVPEVFATAQRVKEAQEARGLIWEKGSPIQRLRRHLPLLAPIFLLTLRRSQTMAWALEARGFQMSPRRSYYLEIGPTWRDWLALGVGVAGLAFFIFLHLSKMDRIPGLMVG